MANFRILALGDVVGAAAGELLAKSLWDIRRETAADMVIVNGENASGIHGLTPEQAEELFRSGADVITGGNHTFYPRGIGSALEERDYLLRPANLSARVPGRGDTVTDINGVRVLVMNLLGRVNMDPVNCPFETGDRILEARQGQYDIAVCDFHAEATSEKAALARYFDGRLAAVFGTHTHVQTADARVLPGGTGFLTDLGMCGPEDSILGVKNDIIINRFLTGLPARFEVAEGAIEIRGAVFEVNLTKKFCEKVFTYVKK